MSSILYIEDDPNNRMLVNRVFRAMAPDFIYFEAATAQAGIQIAQEKIPDLILMDISMPDMDGLTATARIRQIENIRRIPIIALTANAMEGDRERFIAAGCDGYISKPIDIDTFVDTVRTYLKPKPVEAPAPAVPAPAAAEPVPAADVTAAAAPSDAAPVSDTVVTPEDTPVSDAAVKSDPAVSSDPKLTEQPKVLESSKDGGAL